MWCGAPFVESCARHLTSKIYQHVYDFARYDLAGILFRCVECLDTPRESADELTATSFVNQLVLGNPIIYDMGFRLLILKAYWIERINRGFALLPISDRTINRLSGGEEHYRDMVNFLGTLEQGNVEYLLNRAADEVCWDHDFTKLVLGRYVWDLMYRPLQGYLPGMYGEVLFG